MNNVTKIRPDKPLTTEQIARSAVEDMERELLAIGIDVNAIDDEEE